MSEPSDRATIWIPLSDLTEDEWALLATRGGWVRADGNGSSYQARLMDGGFLQSWEIKGTWHRLPPHFRTNHQTPRVTTKLPESLRRRQMCHSCEFDFCPHYGSCQLGWTCPMEHGHLNTPRGMLCSWPKWPHSDWSSISLVIFILWVKTEVSEFAMQGAVGHNNCMWNSSFRLCAHLRLEGMGRRLKGDR